MVEECCGCLCSLCVRVERDIRGIVDMSVSRMPSFSVSRDVVGATYPAVANVGWREVAQLSLMILCAFRLAICLHLNAWSLYLLQVVLQMQIGWLVVSWVSSPHFNPFFKGFTHLSPNYF